MKKVINNIFNFFSRLSKKTKITILVVTLLILGVTVLYQTFATSSTISGDSTNGYTVTLDNSGTVSIPASGSKTVYFKVKNTNNATVKYGVGYSGSNITVKEYSDSDNPSAGTISKGESKFVKLHITNSGTSASTATITTILGYENGGDLIVPSGYTLVTSIYTVPVNLVTHITKLYTSATKSPVKNNGDTITYNYAAEVGLMNDRLGSMSTLIDSGNIRYYGASPNNYIYFNCSDYNNQSSSTCEVWRIIGVFDGKVKLIRNESIGNYAWDNKNTSTGAETDYGKNDWTEARLMKLLNPGYDSETIGGSLYYNAESGTCYVGKNNATTECDFTNIGIKNDETRSLISDTTYYLGGWNSTSVYSNQIYEYERGTTVYTGRPTTWPGKIALPYPSDYGYAADLGKCLNKQLSSYNDSTCTSNNWMMAILATNYDWLLTPHSVNSNYAWYVYSSGFVNGISGAYLALGVAPVLSLSSELSIKAGTGSSSEPYQLAV